MSEKYTPHSPEHANKHEQERTESHSGKHIEREKVDYEHESKKQESGEQSARKSVEKLALSGKEHTPKSAESGRKSAPPRGIKKQNYQITMKRVESKLPGYQRAFSKFIRQDTVDAVSNVAGKTVARPSGIMGAGIFAFVGLTIIYFFANKIGFTLSGTEFILFLLFGWIFGIALEYIYKSIKYLATK